MNAHRNRLGEYPSLFQAQVWGLGDVGFTKYITVGSKME